MEALILAAGAAALIAALYMLAGKGRRRAASAGAPRVETPPALTEAPRATFAAPPGPEDTDTAWRLARLEDDLTAAAAERERLLAQHLETAGMLDRIRAKVEGLGPVLSGRIFDLQPGERKDLERLAAFGISEAGAEIRRAGALRDALATLKRVWRDPQSSEAACVQALAQNLWILEPDYRRTGDAVAIAGYAPLDLLADRFFPRRDPAWAAQFPDTPQTGVRAGLVGQFDTEDGFQTWPSAAPNDTLLIVELLRPGDTVDSAAMERAMTAAYALLKTVDPAQCRQIDVLVAGGRVGDHVERMWLDWADAPRRTIKVMPLGYGDLIARAERLAGVSAEAAASPIEMLTPDGDAGSEPLDLSDADAVDRAAAPDDALVLSDEIAAPRNDAPVLHA